MPRYPVQVFVPVLVGVVFAALPVVHAAAITSAHDDRGSGPGIPEFTVAAPATDSDDPETPPSDDERIGGDEGQSALAIALGIAGLAVLLAVAARWMVDRSDIDDLPPDGGRPDRPGGEVP